MNRIETVGKALFDRAWVSHPTKKPEWKGDQRWYWCFLAVAALEADEVAPKDMVSGMTPEEYLKILHDDMVAGV